jgi:hypothetical protein
MMPYSAEEECCLVLPTDEGFFGFSSFSSVV